MAIRVKKKTESAAQKCKHCDVDLWLTSAGLICPDGHGGIIGIDPKDRETYPERLCCGAVPSRPVVHCSTCNGTGHVECEQCGGDGETCCDHCGSWIECEECCGDGEYDCPDCEEVTL